MSKPTYTVVTLAEHFGVSIGTMRKWLAEAGAIADGTLKTEGRGRPALTYPPGVIKLLEREKMAA